MFLLITRSESREMQCSEQGSRRHRSSGSQAGELGSWQPAQVPAAEGLQLQLAWRNLSRTQQKVEKGSHRALSLFVGSIGFLVSKVVGRENRRGERDFGKTVRGRSLLSSSGQQEVAHSKPRLGTVLFLQCHTVVSPPGLCWTPRPQVLQLQMALASSTCWHT